MTSSNASIRRRSFLGVRNRDRGVRRRGLGLARAPRRRLENGVQSKASAERSRFNRAPSRRCQRRILRLLATAGTASGPVVDRWISGRLRIIAVPDSVVPLLLPVAAVWVVRVVDRILRCRPAASGSECERLLADQKIHVKLQILSDATLDSGERVGNEQVERLLV